MRIAVAGNLASAGIAIADINLKLIWDVIAAIKIGDTGHALVVDDSGRLIAHPDISQVLRGNAGSGDFLRLKYVVDTARFDDRDHGHWRPACRRLSAPAANLGWTVIAQQPVLEAFDSIRAALWRSFSLIAIGALIAFALAYWLAPHVRTDRQLEDGVKRIGTGQFDHRIAIAGGDELEQLATRFNQMAGELAVSKQKSDASIA